MAVESLSYSEGSLWNLENFPLFYNAGAMPKMILQISWFTLPTGIVINVKLKSRVGSEHWKQDSRGAQTEFRNRMVDRTIKVPQSIGRSTSKLPES